MFPGAAIYYFCGFPLFVSPTIVCPITLYSLFKLIQVMEELQRSNQNAIRSGAASYSKPIAKAKVFIVGLTVEIYFVTMPYIIAILSITAMQEVPLAFISAPIGVLMFTWPHFVLVSFPGQQKNGKRKQDMSRSEKEKGKNVANRRMNGFKNNRKSILAKINNDERKVVAAASEQLDS
mmetsp:Transcript_31787/g.54888  ORF Transcript_31787/g.54888 Transcript_31787/m.54888 type:complete len:178 (+) Transcript_31787:3-536(+)